MPAIQRTMRKTITVGNEDVVFVCRVPSAAEISGFLQSRFKTRRNKVEQNLYPARIAFADSILVDLANVTYETESGEQRPLNAATTFTDEDRAYWSKIEGVPVTSWKQLVPVNWKSALAMEWEEGNAGDGDEPGN